jgi:beta-lactam-binding protein with PASTA domain
LLKEVNNECPKIFFLYALLGALTDAATASTAMTIIPELYGLTEDKAREQLRAAGVSGQIHVEQEAEHQSATPCERKDVETDRVCGQSPLPGGEQPAQLDVWLVLKSVEMQSVPRFPGSMQRAREVYRNRKYRGELITKIVPASECIKDRVPKGDVCKQLPAAWAEVPVGTPITLYLMGERTIEDPYGYLPDVLGLGLEEAKGILREFNFTGPVFVKFSDDSKCKPYVVCECHADSGFYEPSKPVARHAALVVTMGSKFPRKGQASNRELMRMPDLTGLTEQEARERMDMLGLRAKIGLHPTQGCETQEVQTAERICGQRPGFGQYFRARTSVTYVLENRRQAAPKPDWIPMPSLLGMRLEDAKASLQEGGITRIEVEHITRAGCVPERVCDSAPKAGRRAYLDTPKTLFTGNIPPIASDDAITITQGDTHPAIDVLGNDRDDDGDRIAVEKAAAKHGTVVIGSSGALKYTPHQGYVGVDTVEYSIADGHGGSDAATLTVTIAIAPPPGAEVEVQAEPAEADDPAPVAGAPEPTPEEPFHVDVPPLFQ